MISLQSQRVFFSDNGTLLDVSKSVNNAINSESATIDFVDGEDYLYIGSPIPFINRYVQVGTANDQDAVASVEIWDGSTWNAAVDVIDDTEVNGKALAQSGVIQWTTDKDKSWVMESTTEDIPALASLRVYNMHWARISYSADLKAETSFSYLGWKFSNDSDLGAVYPDLANASTLDAFSSGKTSWNDQHILAAEILIADLIRQNYINSGNQIFAYEQFNFAAIHKVAELVFEAFGDNFTDQKASAIKNYKMHMKQGIYVIDRNEDGHKTEYERSRVVGLHRV